MVWFQCEDCGENLKKPKLPNHFRSCSAFHLSCIDCGQTFTQHSVQSHTQCMTEAEKYGPKGGHSKPPANAATLAKPKDTTNSKPTPDFDTNVGLSTRPPWSCSLCNTSTTSKQTLLLHAQGKKHRAKARAFHASQNPPSDKAQDSTANQIGKTKGLLGGGVVTDEKCDIDAETTEETTKGDNLKKSEQPKEKDSPSKDANLCSNETVKQTLSTKKRKLNASSPDLSSGEVIQAERVETDCVGKKKKSSSSSTEKDAKIKQKIKWKKLITSSLKLAPDGVLKIKKLEKLVLKSLQESGDVLDGTPIRDILVEKIQASSKLELDKKLVRLVAKCAP